MVLSNILYDNLEVKDVKKYLIVDGRILIVNVLEKKDVGFV